MVKIIDHWTDSVDCSTYYTVQISENRFVDVKCCSDGFAYIMQCEDGNEIYDNSQNTYAEEIPNGKEIVDDVLRYHNYLTDLHSESTTKSMGVKEIEERVKEIDDILFNPESKLDGMERKTLETEREDLLYYLE